MGERGTTRTTETTAAQHRDRPAAEAPPGGGPSWEGRTGKLGYLAKMFPRISETFILKEVLALRRQGIPVQIYSLLPPTRDPRMHAEAEKLLPEVDVLPEPAWRGTRGFVADLMRCLRSRPGATLREVLRVLSRPRQRTFRRFSRAVALAVRLRRDRVAHLHAAWAHTPASVARITVRLSGIPWSMAGHAKDIHLSRRSSLAKKIRSARFTMTCTNANHRLLEEIAGPSQDSVPPPALSLFYHGVNTSRFSATVSPEPAVISDETTPLILSVGRLVPKKGFDLLIQAVAILKERQIPVRVEIVGEGTLRSALEEQIASLELGGIVRLRGMLIQEEVRAAYQCATCMVLASRITENGDRDGIPNTLAEAMACSLPVVATRLPSIQELISDGETGLLVPADDAPALAQALERLIADPPLRRRLGNRGRQWVTQYFDARFWERQTAERLARTLGIERALYLTADRGVPVKGSKGAAVHVRAVVRALTQLGVETLLVTTRRGPADGPALPATIVKTGTDAGWKQRVERFARVLRGGQPLARALLRLGDNLPLYREAHRQARAWHPDLIYERYALTAFAGSLLARRLGIPHILEVNAPLAEEEARFRDLRLGMIARAMERWILRRADRVIVVSRSLERYVESIGVPARRIVLLPNAVDPALFHPDREGERVRRPFGRAGDFVIGFSGTLKPWHGLHHLLRAMSQATSASAATSRATAETAAMRLLVIGDGPERECLQRLAGELGLADRVFFTGAVPHEEVGEFLGACDLLAAPYGPLENHWFSPLKVREYLAAGRPVIASAIGQLKESFGEAQGVVLVPPGDEASLAQALTELAGNPARREQLARNAAAVPPWTWVDLARSVLAETEAARREIWGWDHA